MDAGTVDAGTADARRCQWGWKLATERPEPLSARSKVWIHGIPVV
jgi:hypothetical protein